MIFHIKLQTFTLSHHNITGKFARKTISARNFIGKVTNIGKFTAKIVGAGKLAEQVTGKGKFIRKIIAPESWSGKSLTPMPELVAKPTTGARDGSSGEGDGVWQGRSQEFWLVG